MISNAWANELWRIAGLLTAASILGLVFGPLTLFLLLAVLAYLARHLYQLYRLERWLSLGRKGPIPDAQAAWGDIFYEIHRMQKRNRTRKRKLASLLRRFNESTAAMPDATVIINGQDEMEWYNKAACNLLGLHPKSDVGQRIDNLVRFPEFIAYLDAGDYSRPLEIPSPVDLTTMLMMTIVPYGKKRRLMVVRDVTRLHQLEKMRRDFVANVTHELRTPLTVISGYLESLEDDAGTEANKRDWSPIIHQMKQQADRMQHIVQDLLLLSRLETGDDTHIHDQVAVPALLTAIREDALTLSGGKIAHIELDLDRDLWLSGNEQELHSAFSNLVFNAVKYTPAGGSITIHWQAGGEEEGGAELRVSDTGIGIPPQHIPRLTERFYRVDTGRSRDQGGTGLGLAIVKHVLIRHQGGLDIHSEPGAGSTFTCRFPSRVVIRRNQPEALAS